jgi:hypothetical protein
MLDYSGRILQLLHDAPADWASCADGQPALYAAQVIGMVAGDEFGRLDYLFLADGTRQFFVGRATHPNFLRVLY